MEHKHAHVAVLFIQPHGTYRRMRVDRWDEKRDARTYDGSVPVVAHPPCATWGRYAHKAGGVGNDNGCFASALATVRRVGGVIEHPANSRAWARFGLPLPMEGPDIHGGWTLAVNQYWWCHRAIKPTWLYILGTRHAVMPVRDLGGCIPLEHQSKRERASTPPAFARWLVALARTCNPGAV